MNEIVAYLALLPIAAMACLIIAYPFVQRAKKRKLEETNRTVQQILDECKREIELRTRFEAAYHEKRKHRKVINVDFVNCDSENNNATEWKLVYNEKLGVYQKVRR